MKIAYVTTYDSSDVHAWSGLGQYIFRALEESGCQTKGVGNLNQKKDFLSRVKKAIHRRLSHKVYINEREPRVLKDYARQVEAILKGVEHDIIFSPGTIPIAHLKTEKPIVFWTDSTFAGMVDYYPELSNLCAETIRHGNQMEQLALSKCALAIYSSEWAANTAIRNYQVDPAKVKVVPFGANITCDRTLEDIRKIMANKDFSNCKLLFLGVDWERKGGDVALEVTRLLNERGIKTELHIVGCTPPGKSPDFVINHGFISKKEESGKRQLDALMAESHFLIVPSKAECFGVVFAEASSFGLPSLATKAGGIPSAILDGKNGRTFALDENPATYADYIAGLMASREDYADLAESCFKEYSERLNWTVAGKTVRDLVENLRSQPSK